MLIEAMRVGVPVVGTSVGGLPDVIEHKHNGLLVEYADMYASLPFKARFFGSSGSSVLLTKQKDIAS